MKLADITNMVFGQLTAIEKHHIAKNKTYWKCKCSCGNISIVYLGHLKNGHTKSCGCYLSEFAKTHGQASGENRSKEYEIWAAMIKRCNNKNDPKYSSYGGRGIKVCERWLSFENFIADVGKRPSNKHSLDRFPDNDGNYEPFNFRWATIDEQNRNLRSNVHLEYGGKKMVLADWAKELKVASNSISLRLKKGQSFSEIFHYLQSDVFRKRQYKRK